MPIYDWYDVLDCDLGVNEARAYEHQQVFSRLKDMQRTLSEIEGLSIVFEDGSFACASLRKELGLELARRSALE